MCRATVIDFQEITNMSLWKTCSRSSRHSMTPIFSSRCQRKAIRMGATTAFSTLPRHARLRLRAVVLPESVGQVSRIYAYQQRGIHPIFSLVTAACFKKPLRTPVTPAAGPDAGTTARAVVGMTEGLGSPRPTGASNSSSGPRDTSGGGCW